MTCNMTFNIFLHVSLLCGAFKIASSKGNVLREKKTFMAFVLCKTTSLLSCNSVFFSTAVQINGCVFWFSERSNHSMGREARENPWISQLSLNQMLSVWEHLP